MLSKALCNIQQQQKLQQTLPKININDMSGAARRQKGNKSESGKRINDNNETKRKRAMTACH